MRLIDPIEAFKDERGRIETIISGTPWKEINRITSEKGIIRGNHYHKKTVEMILVLEGSMEFEITKNQTGEIHRFVLAKDKGVMIEPGELHVVKTLEKTVVLNFLTKEFDKEDPDIY